MALTYPFLSPLKPNKSKQKPPAIASNDEGLRLRTHFYPPSPQTHCPWPLKPVTLWNTTLTLNPLIFFSPFHSWLRQWNVHLWLFLHMIPNPQGWSPILILYPFIPYPFIHRPQGKMSEGSPFLSYLPSEPWCVSSTVSTWNWKRLRDKTHIASSKKLNKAEKNPEITRKICISRRKCGVKCYIPEWK